MVREKIVTAFVNTRAAFVASYVCIKLSCSCTMPYAVNETIGKSGIDPPLSLSNS